jgi:hypothetical protein
MLAKFDLAPDELTNNILNQIGTKYIENYGEEPQASCFCCFFHNSQPIARKLKDFNAPTPRDRWYFLVDIYKNLKSNKSEIAETIRNLFNSVYKKIEIENPYDSDEDLSPYDISEQMKNVLNEYYLKQNDTELEGLRGQLG